MSPVLRWGIDVVLWWQRLSPALDIPMTVITHAGDGAFYAALLAIVYWAIDQRLAARLALFLLASAVINVAAKELAAQPRPFEVDPRVLRLVPVSGGGMPSGHVQNACVVWGYLAWRSRRAWCTVLAVTMIILVALSRLYVGVHFPTDLLGGFVLGALTLSLGLAIEARAPGRLPQGHASAGIAILAMTGLLSLASLLWLPGATARYVFSALVAVLALAAQRRWLPFAPAKEPCRRVRALLVGLAALAFVCVVLLSAWCATGGSSWLSVVAYPVLVASALLVVPWSLLRLGLADATTARVPA